MSSQSRAFGYTSDKYLQEDLKVLADVRTLDAWAVARASNVPQIQREQFGRSWSLFLYDDANNERVRFDGATPDETRAKAAAWVREQVKL